MPKVLILILVFSAFIATATEDWSYLPSNIFSFDGRTVSRQEFFKENSSQIDRIIDKADGSRSQTRQMLRSFIRQYCRSLIQLKLARRHGIMISSEKMDIAYEKEIERLGGRQAAQKYFIDSGQSSKELQEKIFKDLLISQWVDEYLLKEIKVSDEDLQVYYNEHSDEFTQSETYRLFFFVAPGRSHKGNWQPFIKSQLGQAVTAEDLEKKYGLKQPGGKAWWQLDELPPNLRKTLEGAKAGSISNETLFGDRPLVIFCSQIRPPGKKDFLTVKDDLRRFLSYRLVEKKVIALVEKELKVSLKILF